MCGICGVWYYSQEKSVDGHVLKRMTDEISHRGPDEEGFHCEGSVGLGFRRLSIIDVGGSHQPMSNEDGSIWIVFNGEIYNFQSLRQGLVDHHNFKTSGDTETIIHAYEDFGMECVDHFRGMYGFAIWDSSQQTLTLAVDRFGKKPLYYYQDDEKFIFASELKSILQHPDVPREVDPEALDEYLGIGYIRAPRSIFKYIRKVSPAHILSVQADGRIRERHYWNPDFAEPDAIDNRSFEAILEEFRPILLEAVRLRMISDVPLGAFLSGGVDSSAVVALMSQLSNQPVKTFSVGFDESEFDETHYAKLVADYCKTDHIREVIRPDVASILPKLIHQFDEPFADTSLIPTYYISEVARRHVTVALSGDGGDEVFGGYNHHKYGYRQALLQKFIPVSLRHSAAKLGAILPDATKIAPYLKTVDQPANYWIRNRSGMFSPEQRSRLYSADLVGSLSRLETELLKMEMLKISDGYDTLTQLQYYDLRGYMPGDILVKVDRASMLASLEVRSPLLDHKVFEFVAKTPSHFRTSLNDTKVLLKRAVGDRMPPQIHNRHKQGFSIPQSEWLAGPLNTLLRDTVLSQRAKERGWFNFNTVEQMINHHDGSNRWDYRPWGLLMLEMWAREYLDQ